MVQRWRSNGSGQTEAVKARGWSNGGGQTEVVKGRGWPNGGGGRGPTGLVDALGPRAVAVPVQVVEEHRVPRPGRHLEAQPAAPRQNRQRSNSGQTAVKKWANSGQTEVKQRSNSGQTAVKRWSNIGKRRQSTAPPACQQGPPATEPSFHCQPRAPCR